MNILLKLIYFIITWTYHLQKKRARQGFVIEQVGTFDPLENIHGEKLCSLNLQRIGHWIGQGATVAPPVAQLLGN